MDGLTPKQVRKLAVQFSELGAMLRTALSESDPAELNELGLRHVLSAANLAEMTSTQTGNAGWQCLSRIADFESQFSTEGKA